MKTLHGEFEFSLQKYLGNGSSVSYFELTQQMLDGCVSDRLREMSCYDSNRMRYEEVAQFVERVSGAALLSDQSIWQMVNRKAVEVSEQVEEAVKATLNGERKLADVNADVDLYDASVDEIIMFEDGFKSGSKRAREWVEVNRR